MKGVIRHTTSSGQHFFSSILFWWLACLRFARRGDDRSERDERGVEDASREPIENAIEVFEEEDDREDADRENAPDPPGRKPKRRRVRRKTSAEAARAALLRERNNGDDTFGS